MDEYQLCTFLDVVGKLVGSLGRCWF